MNFETVQKWLMFAEGNLKTAEDEFHSSNPVLFTVCFHAQQAVEKYLKAYLIICDHPIRKTHDITELIEICKTYDPEFEFLYELRANRLTRYAVEIRYPDDFYIPTLQEAKECIDIA